MDYKSAIKEKLGKLLFLEMNIEGFKKLVGIPEYVTFENKDLYIPISSSYISSNAGNEIKIKNIPIYYFIEGMFLAIGCDESLRFNDDYELILDYIKDTENCIKSLISKNVENDNLLDGYLLLKGYYNYSKDLEVMKKLLLVGEALREKDSGFNDILLEEIEYCEKSNISIAEPYLYKAIIYRDKGDFSAARVAMNEYHNRGGKVTEEVEIINRDIDNVFTYEKAIELLNEDPEKSIEMLLKLTGDFDENPLIYYYIALGFRKIDDYQKAIQYLKESLQRESGILEVVVELGVNYACLGEFNEAIKYFRKAFEASKEVEICTNIVMCYLNLNDYENAKLHLDIAKNINADDEIVKQLENIVANY